MIALVLGLVAGIASTVHASVNSQIRYETKSPYIPMVFNFVTASAIMAIALFITQKNLSIPFAEIAEKPIWIWFGGLCGTTIVILNILCLPKLGSAKNVMIICFGQVMAGLLIDHFGIFESPVVSFNFRRLIGAILVIAGIAMVNGINLNKKDNANNDRTISTAKEPILYWILALICGIACAVQIAVNGTLKVVTGSAITSSLISMSVGLICTSILICFLLLKGGESAFFESEENRGPCKLWMCINGIIGISIVGGNSYAAPIIGAGMVTVINLVGMMGAGLAIDATGFLGIEKQPVTRSKLIGMLLMIVGTAIISL